MRGNRETGRKYLDPAFIRKADGRLSPSSDERDIKDVWADLDRVKLKDAIERDQKKQAKKARRRNLFGAVKASERLTEGSESAKTVEIKINFSGLSLGWLRRWARSAKAAFGRTTRKQRGAAIGLLVFAALFAASFNLYGNSKSGIEGRQKDVAGARISEIPTFTTVLPIDKKIDDLGGWKRVSPKDKEPVYAFNDQVDGVQITVSEQPLPEAFKEDTETHIAKLAKDFAANEKITAGLSHAYVGTSAKGPQSVILTKNDLLILIQSASSLSNAQWEGYLATLQ